METESFHIGNERNNVDILGGNITGFIDKEDNVVGRRSVPTIHQEISDYMKRHCAFNCMSVMYKMNCVAGYLEHLQGKEYKYDKKI